MVLCGGDGRVDGLAGLGDRLGDAAVVQVDLVLEAHPAEQTEAKGKVEEAFIGNAEDDEGRRELQEHHDESMDVVAVWVQAVEIW